jgi:hypothetical protein
MYAAAPDTMAEQEGPGSTKRGTMTSDSDAWLQRVRYTAAEPTSWLLHAQTLRQAAEDLWTAGNAHDHAPGSERGATVLASWISPGFVRPETGGSTFQVCVMVFGFALENLAKGIIVCRDPSVVTKKQLRRWHGNGHDLARLFERARIFVSDDERQLLDRTTRTTEWKGRYPVAMNFDEVGSQDRVLGYIAFSGSWPAAEYAGLSDLYERARISLVDTMEQVPPLPADYSFG